MNWPPDTADPSVGSYMPLFRWAVDHTSGAVLELGGGYFSSPVIHELDAAGRVAWTYEPDPYWAGQIRQRFAQPVTSNFLTLPFRHWDVVLVDCEGWNRQEFLEDLRSRTRIFVVHDSQDHWIPEDVLESFAYRADRDLNPRTTLVSDGVDVREAP